MEPENKFEDACIATRPAGSDWTLERATEENAKKTASPEPSRPEPPELERIDYNERAAYFLKAAGISFAVQLIGDSCPQFCEDAGKPGIGTFPRKTHMHGQHWRATFSRPERGPLTVDFWDSYQDSIRRYCAVNWGKWSLGTGNNAKIEALNCWNGRPTRAQWDIIEANFPPREWRNLEPSAYDVLSCIDHSEPTAPFEEWAGEFGYDPDSRRVERVYQAVCEQWRETFRFFSAEELETLGEIAV